MLAYYFPIFLCGTFEPSNPAEANEARQRYKVHPDRQGQDRQDPDRYAPDSQGPDRDPGFQGFNTNPL